MSLRRLLKQNKWSIQTNKYAVRSDDGSILRQDGWYTKYKNLYGNVQSTVTSSSKGKDDIIDDYNKLELMSFYTIFHNYTSVIFTPNLRILIHHDPTQAITFLNSGDVNFNIHKREEIRIFEFIGVREPVGKRNHLKHFEVYLKQIFRQTI